METFKGVARMGHIFTLKHAKAHSVHYETPFVPNTPPRFMKSPLVTLSDAPLCSRASCIATGYRRETPFWPAMCTVLAWHNESVNIWSHLFGGGLFVVLAMLNHGNSQPAIPMFCGTVAFGFTASGMFHVLCCTSDYYKYALTLDFIGMLGIITACVGTATYASTFQVPWLCSLHLSVFVALIAWTLKTLWTAASANQSERVFRCRAPAVCISASVSYWLLAAAHAALVGHTATAKQILATFGPEWLLWMAAFGAWKAREPERQFPLAFDYVVSHETKKDYGGPWMENEQVVFLFFRVVFLSFHAQGNSHNIFHVVGVIAAYWHYGNLLVTLNASKTPCF